MEKNEVMNNTIKKETLELGGIDIAQFTKMVQTFRSVVATISDKQLQKYMYYPVRNYDFVQFVKKINRFCDNYSIDSIINKLAQKEEAKKVN